MFSLHNLHSIARRQPSPHLSTTFPFACRKLITLLESQRSKTDLADRLAVLTFCLRTKVFSAKLHTDVQKYMPAGDRARQFSQTHYDAFK